VACAKQFKLKIMLYTRKGDDGTTKTLHCDQRMTKGSLLADALGTVDELNVWLGYCKAKLKNENFVFFGENIAQILELVQQKLFITQAELAGAPEKSLKATDIQVLEKIIDGMEESMPKIESFFIPGATELSGVIEYGRVIARRAERSVIKAVDSNEVKINDATKGYLNRLSSLLYVLTRYINHEQNASESAPDYL